MKVMYKVDKIMYLSGVNYELDWIFFRVKSVHVKTTGRLVEGK